MGNLIIKGKGGAGNKLILQDQAGAAVLTTADSGATVANATLASTTTFPTGVIIGVENTTTTTIVAKSDTNYATVISDSITVKAGSKVLINVSCPVSASGDSDPAGGQILQTGTASATIMAGREIMDEHHASSGGYFGITLMSGVLSAAGSYTFSFQGNKLSGDGTVYFVSANPGSGSASIASMTLYEIAG